MIYLHEKNIHTHQELGFLDKVFEWLKNELSPCAFFHGQ